MFPQVWEVIPDLAHLNTLLDGDIIEEGMVRRKKERKVATEARKYKTVWQNQRNERDIK